jgi:hypothetical protein
MRELPTAKLASSKPNRCEHRGAELLGMEPKALAVLNRRGAALGFELDRPAGFELKALAVSNCRGAALGFELGRLDGLELPR